MVMRSVLTSLKYIGIHYVPVSTLPVVQGKHEDTETFSPTMEVTEANDGEDYPSLLKRGKSDLESRNVRARMCL